MTIDAVSRFRRLSKELDAAALKFSEELKTIWDDHEEVIRVLNQTREALASIQGALDVLGTAINRIEELRIRDRRKHLQVVREIRKGSGGERRSPLI